MAMPDFIKDTFIAAERLFNEQNYKRIVAQVEIVANQESGVCTYAIGPVYYSPTSAGGAEPGGGVQLPRPAQFSTNMDEKLKTYRNRAQGDLLPMIDSLVGEMGVTITHSKDPNGTDSVGVVIATSGGTIRFSAGCLNHVLFGCELPEHLERAVWLLNITAVQPLGA